MLDFFKSFLNFVQKEILTFSIIPHIFSFSVIYYVAGKLRENLLCIEVVASRIIKLCTTLVVASFIHFLEFGGTACGASTPKVLK